MVESKVGRPACVVVVTNYFLIFPLMMASYSCFAKVVERGKVNTNVQIVSFHLLDLSRAAHAHKVSFSLVLRKSQTAREREGGLFVENINKLSLTLLK